jgi:hypothetical protein
MNFIRNTYRFALRTVTPVLILAVCSAPLWAQDKTTTTVRHEAPKYETEVRNARIVYVEGNDLVLRLENGTVEHLIVPDEDRFNIDGKSLTVSELTPGTTLTQTIETVTTPRFVKTVRVLQGKVWHVNRPNHVILTLPDGTNHSYTIPKHAKITVNGQPATGFDLKKGHQLQATIVTDEPHTVIAKSKTVVGHAPAPVTPALVGLLLFNEAPKSVAPTLMPESVAAPVAVASAEPVVAVLPKTASLLPLLGLLGFGVIGVSLALKGLRRSFVA